MIAMIERRVAAFARRIDDRDEPPSFDEETGGAETGDRRGGERDAMRQAGDLLGDPIPGEIGPDPEQVAAWFDAARDEAEGLSRLPLKTVTRSSQRYQSGKFAWWTDLQARAVRARLAYLDPTARPWTPGPVWNLPQGWDV